MVWEAWIHRMGNNASLKKTLLMGIDPKKKKNKKAPKPPSIGILSFEVANVMSKAVQLWQSLGNAEVQHLQNEVVKAEGVLYLVSEDEAYLLGLACAEKLEDLDQVAAAVSRLGRKCQEPALQGFEHIYSDLLGGNVDFRDLEFLIKDMDVKVKKMERYISATSNLYQELEVLTDLEHSARKLQTHTHNLHSLQQRLPQSDGNGADYGGSAANGNLCAFQQKIQWQRQEIKHLRDVSLWNQSFDKVVGLLARTVCTIYGRICCVFGESSILGSLPVEVRSHFPPHLFDDEGDSDEVHQFSALSGPLEPCRRGSGPLLRNGHHSREIREVREIRFASGPLERQPVEAASPGHRSGPILSRGGSKKVCQSRDLRIENGSSLISANWSASPGRLFKECLNLNGSSSPTERDSPVEYGGIRACGMVESRNCETPTGAKTGNGFHYGSRILPPSGPLQQHLHVGPVSRNRSIVPRSGPMLHSAPVCYKRQHTRSRPGVKDKLVRAPPSTLGGAALALHYANVIILVEKLVRFPHLVGHDARDDLYQMLPTSVRIALRSRLKSYAKNLASAIYDAPLAADWKDALETILGWLAPLAHNMIRWQSEHNFEQQQVVSRTNVLLLQTLYFADQAKTEATITELLVGLNYICRYEQEVRANDMLDCTSSQDYDEYLEWHV